MTASSIDFIERENDAVIARHDVLLIGDELPERIFVAELVSNKSMGLAGHRFIVDSDQCELAGGYDGQHTFKKASEAMLFLETKFLPELFL
jgi:hypothetical protein